MDHTINLKKEQGADDVRIWEWLLSLLEVLEEDGMSSEESDIDARMGMEVYHCKKMPWRRNVDWEMGLIDKERVQDKKVYSKRGAKPVVRVRNGERGDTRGPAPTGLPQSFYEKEWLAAQSDVNRRGLNISQKKFKWFMIL